MSAPLQATFQLKQGALLVRDEGTPSGVYLNETRVQRGQTVQLLRGDRVRLGNTTLTVAEGPPPPPAREGFALVLSDGRTFPVAQKTFIGRNPESHIFLPDPWVSRRHATVWVDAGTLYVRDEEARIGTFLNEARLAPGQPTALHMGDVLRLGATTLTVADAAGAALPSPATLAVPARVPDPTGPFQPVRVGVPDPTLEFALRLPDGREFRIKEEFLIGRAPPCDLVLADGEISEVHAALWASQGLPYVRDEHSLNGVIVNGSRIISGLPYPLRVGDNVRFGATDCAIVPGGPARPPPPSAPTPRPVSQPALDATLPGASPVLAPTPAPPSGFVLQRIGGERIPLKGDVRLGRDAECDVVLEDPRVSRHHATVLLEQGELFVRDEGSRNGTFVAGQRLNAAQMAPLRVGDELRVGGITFVVRSGPAP